MKINHKIFFEIKFYCYLCAVIKNRIIMCYYNKRDNSIIEKANGVVSSLNEEDAKVIKNLIEKYEKATYKEYDDRHEFYRESVSDMVNDMGFKDDELAESMAKEHPTLQQSFFRFVKKFILKMADKTYYDGRNEAAVKACKNMAEMLKDVYVPMI